MGEDNITREEIKLIVELGNEKVKGEIMERVIHNEGNIENNKDDVGEIKDDVKTIMKILRNKNQLMIGTLVTGIITVLTLAVTIIVVLL